MRWFEKDRILILFNRKLISLLHRNYLYYIYNLKKTTKNSVWKSFYHSLSQ
jgi:hypothetical protein